MVTWNVAEKKNVSVDAKEKCAEMVDTCCKPYLQGFEGLSPVQSSQETYSDVASFSVQ